MTKKRGDASKLASIVVRNCVDVGKVFQVQPSSGKGPAPWDIESLNGESGCARSRDVKEVPGNARELAKENATGELKQKSPAETKKN